MSRRRHRQRDDEDIVVALAIGFDCATAVQQIQAMATAKMAAADRPTVRIGRTAAGWQVTEPPRKGPPKRHAKRHKTSSTC